MPRLFRGWRVVLCCFCMAFLAWGLGFYGVSVCLVRLREANGWSAAAIGTAVTFYNLILAALVMLAGDAIERWGARRVVLCGALSFGRGAMLAILWRPRVGAAGERGAAYSSSQTSSRRQPL